MLRTSQGSVRSKRAYRPRMDWLEDRTVPVFAIFNIEPTFSVLTLSGTVGGAAIQQQGPGSLSTGFAGYIDTEIDFSAGTIRYTGLVTAVALNSGSWQPRANGAAGSEPANYGGTVSLLGTALAAVRNVEVTATSNPLALTDIGGGYYSHESRQTLTIAAGDADYSHPVLGSGRASLANNSAVNMASESYLYDFGDGSHVYLVGEIALTINATVSGIMATLNIRGTIFADGFIYAGPGGAPSGGSGSSQADLGAGLAYVTTVGSELTPPDSSLTVQQVPAHQFVTPTTGQDQPAPVETEVVAPVMTAHEAAVDALFGDLFA